MIDTLRMKIFGRGWQSPGVGWTSQTGTKSIQDLTSEESAETNYCMFEHVESGLRIGGSADAPRWFEVSLPRLIYGSNSTLLKESDCASAMLAVHDLVTQSVECPQFLEASRIDLVGQFKGNVRMWNLAFRQKPHQHVRRRGLEFFDSGIVWPGRHLHIRLYDKGLEESGTPSDCVRLEYQTRGKRLPHRIFDGMKLDYAVAYQSYRRLCLGFNPRAVPVLSKLASLLAWADSCGFQHDGMTVSEYYLRQFTVRHARRMRAQMSQVRLRYLQIDWQRLVPEDGVPAFVDLHEDDLAA